MNSEGDSDEELFQTLSQLHEIVGPSRSRETHASIPSDLSSYSLGINQDDDDVAPHFLSSNGREARGNEIELLNEKKQHRHSRIVSPSSSSSSVIERRKRAEDEEQKESEQRKKTLPLRNHNDADVRNGKAKEKYQQGEGDEGGKSSTTHFSLTSTGAAVSSAFFNPDESRLTTVDPDNHSSLLSPRFLSSLSNDTTLLTNQLMTDHWQTTEPKSNMNRNVTDQTTSDLFDPFAPTTGSPDEMFKTSSNAEASNFGMRTDFLSSNSPATTKSQPLANYDFDDLWNQSISHLTSAPSNAPASSSPPAIDPDTFAWDAFLNTEQTPVVPTSTLTWQTLFDQPKELEDSNDLHDYLQWLLSHFDDQSPAVGHFQAIHNLESIINEIHMSTKPFEPIPSPPLHADHTTEYPTHGDLFSIDEGEQPPSPVRMTKALSFDTEVKPVVEQLVSHTLQAAWTELNPPRDPVEQLVDQVLAQAIVEVHSENDSAEQWHEETLKTSKDLDESDLFSSQSSRPIDREDEETSNLSEYMPPSLITNPFNATRMADNLLKYTLTAPVMDDSGDDSSMLEDYFASHKVISCSLSIMLLFSSLPDVFFEEHE